MAYYEFIIESGLCECYRYVVKVDYPTTDYGALTDILIDNLVAKGSHNIVDINEYEWDGDNLREKENPEWIIYPDEFVQGGNCGDVLLHHGEFRINEISENEIGDIEVMEAM